MFVLGVRLRLFGCSIARVDRGVVLLLGGLDLDFRWCCLDL